MFKKDDYIVILDTDLTGSDCAKNNFIFKQRVDSKSIQPSVDLKGSKSNSNDSCRFDKSGTIQDWRYATLKEIEYYDEIGEPYDITKIEKFELFTEDLSYLIEILNKLNIN